MPVPGIGGGGGATSLQNQTASTATGQARGGQTVMTYNIGARPGKLDGFALPAVVGLMAFMLLRKGAL